jgi:hypothetical protein
MIQGCGKAAKKKKGGALIIYLGFPPQADRVSGMRAAKS